MEILPRDSGATVHAPIACPWPSQPQGNTDQLPFVLLPKQNYSPNLPMAFCLELGLNILPDLRKWGEMKEINLWSGPGVAQ